MSLVYSVGGIAGREARAAEKSVWHCICAPSGIGASQRCGVLCETADGILVVRSNSLLIQGSRESQKPRAVLLSWTVLCHVQLAEEI